MRVLALGDKSQLSQFFPDGIELVNEGPFDNIFLGSHLQIVQRQHVTQVLSKLRNELVSGGHIIATVPSLEWACREIATKDDDLGLGPYLSIYGTETEEHKCGFTMPWLRLCFEEVGLAVTEARSEYFTLTIHMGDQQVQEADRACPDHG